MTDVTRLFAGELTPGDWRARISREGVDAADPYIPRSDLYFDSAWPFAGNIHAVVYADGQFDSPKILNFPELPFVPVVFVRAVSKSGTDVGLITFYNDNFSTLYPIVYNDHVDVQFVDSINGPTGNGESGITSNLALMAVIFRIPARPEIAIGEDPAPRARMLIGKRGTSFGLYSSRPGYDVRTCPDSVLAFNSDAIPITVNATIEGQAQGGSSSPTDNNGNDIDIHYTYKGYKPLILLFLTVQSDNDWYQLPFDKPVAPSWGYVNGRVVALSSPDLGTATIHLVGISTSVNFRYSVIVLDLPLP